VDLLAARIPTGKVYLVGAGPGDPDLLTVKARRLLEQTDLILHDDLVPPPILVLAASRAEIVNVGKRCGPKAITQAGINAYLIAAARQGRNVLRLHGGDPSIFARLAEEIDALEDAGITFEVVPGVTAATAAAAALGLSLTDRRRSSRVIIVSGHRASKKTPAEKTDWKEMASNNATLVVYMPGKDFSGLRQELLAAGLSPDIPAVIVSHVGAPKQRHRYATLGELDKLPPMDAPSVLLIGRSLDGARRKLDRERFSALSDEVDLILSAL
jgi:uroporphyrin-III C-methyltransferase